MGADQGKPAGAVRNSLSGIREGGVRHSLSDGARRLSGEPDGFITVRAAAHETSADPDLQALARLPQCLPLMPPTRGMFGRSRIMSVPLPALRPAGASAVCREYVTMNQRAAVPLCEGQKVLAKKMTDVEALCARILYLLALRANELSACAAALSDLPKLQARLGESNALLQSLVEQADQLNQLLPGQAHGAL